jgi:hypothetical protein
MKDIATTGRFKRCMHMCYTGLVAACNPQALAGYILLESVVMKDKQKAAASAVRFAQSGPSGIKQGKTSLWEQRAKFTKQQRPLNLPVNPAHVRKC